MNNREDVVRLIESCSNTPERLTPKFFKDYYLVVEYSLNDTFWDSEERIDTYEDFQSFIKRSQSRYKVVDATVIEKGYE